MTAVHYTVRTMVLEVQVGVGTAVAHECAITGVTENESHDEISGATACPDGTFTDVGPSRWSLGIDYNVSHVPASFHRLLRENAGLAATITIEPDPVGDPGRQIVYDCPALVSAGAGMVVGSTAAASATLPLNGAPEYVDP